MSWLASTDKKPTSVVKKPALEDDDEAPSPRIRRVNE